MKVICGIYKISNPKGKIYIGRSVNIYKRWYSYKNLHCSSQPKIYNSLKKYGVSSHNFEVLIECNAIELDDLELFFIDLYNSTNNSIGLNCNRSQESKLESYKLEYNKKRILAERKRKKKEYSKKIKVKDEKERANYLGSLQNFIDLQNLPCPFTGKVGFMQNNPPHNPLNKYIYPKRYLPF